MLIKKQAKCFITQRDFEMLKFLWQWRALSTHAIAKKFYPESKAFTAYARLLKLEKKHYIKSISFRHRMGSAWTLDIQGFKFIFPYLLDLKEVGYKSQNIIHDYYSTVFHLGEWLTTAPAHGNTCTEQELRRVHCDLLPSWVPTSIAHRPDGYSFLDNGNQGKLFAFETELTAKSKIRYEQVVDFYDSETSIQAVFWLVGSQAIQKIIVQSLSDYYSKRAVIHNFILLADFKKEGWMTPINSGCFQGKNIMSILLNTSPTIPQHKLNNSDVHALLKNKKRPMLPNEYKKILIPRPLD